jgi:hypothetical protein
VPSVREYFRYFGLDAEKLKAAKDDALVMHPGPMNRGVEIASEIADGPQSVIQRTGRDGRRRPHGGDGSPPRPAPQRGAPRMSPTLFINARVVDPARGLDEQGSVLVAEGRIVAAGASVRNQGAPGGAAVIDCKGAAILPGLVDSRVFIGEPGGEHRETIASASIAAAAGGVTSMVMMPDTDPVIDNVALVEFVQRTARDTARVLVYPAASITKGFHGAEMTEFGLLREAGAVGFTEGRHTISNALIMRRALSYARDFGVTIAHETQDRHLGGGVMNEGLYASWLGLSGIPREAEAIPLERDLLLARLTGGALPRRQDLDRHVGRRDRARKKRRRERHGRRGDPQPVAQRERRRRVSHLLPARTAAAGRGRSPGDDRSAARRDDRPHRPPRTTLRTSTPSACPSRTRPPARSGWRRCSPSRCASITTATFR